MSTLPAADSSLPLAERRASEVFDARSLRALTAPALVSAIANLVVGYLWFFLATCVGIFITAPMLVLGAFEVIFFARGPELRAVDTVRRATALGVFELILGIFNGVSLICGVLVLIQAGRMRAVIDAPGAAASRDTPRTTADPGSEQSTATQPPPETLLPDPDEAGDPPEDPDQPESHQAP